MSAQLKLVQYVVVRRDLLDSLKWPFGAVITQACHACTAIVHMTYNDEQTQMYLADLDNMHKVVLEVYNFLLNKYTLSMLLNILLHHCVIST